MSAAFRLDTTNALSFADPAEHARLLAEAPGALTSLLAKNRPGNDFLGWVKLPQEIDETETVRIETAAARIRGESGLVVVVGIGGSYLGARAVVEALGHGFSNLLPAAARRAPLVVFAGHQIGEDYHAQLLETLDHFEVSVIVISKSGTTTEPALAFRLLKGYMEKRYGRETAARRIYAITDRARGALKSLADTQGYEQFVIPDDVGGRFSVLTPVGLLPIAAAGFDIRALIGGAREAAAAILDGPHNASNPAIAYAACRNALYQKGFTTEIFASYAPNMHFFIEWWKQLYGESEGKDGRGIFPAGVDLTSDLHSMGQMIQDGMRNLFETVFFVENTNRTLAVPAATDDLDGLGFLAGRRINEINRMAMLGTGLAHIDGGVPQINLSVERLDEDTLGRLIYFFEAACGVSGYLLGVNPFDQPGVEAYKKNMFALLGKPGFEKDTAALRARLGQS